jgi:hypothetical protein
MEAVKYDQGKPLPDLVLGEFMEPLMHVVFVGTFGAYKYAPENFKNLPDGERRYREASFRHYMRRRALGEIFDDETGEYHLAHEIWDKIAELHFYLKEREGVEYEARVYVDDATVRYWTPVGWTEDGDEAWLDEHVARQAVWALHAELRDSDPERTRPRPKVEKRVRAEATDGPWWGVWCRGTGLWLRMNGSEPTWTARPDRAFRTRDRSYAERSAGEVMDSEARRLP